MLHSGAQDHAKPETRKDFGGFWNLVAMSGYVLFSAKVADKDKK